MFLIITAALAIFGYNSFKTLNYEQSVQTRILLGKTTASSIKKSIDEVSTALVSISSMLSVTESTLNNDKKSTLAMLQSLKNELGAISSYVGFKNGTFLMDSGQLIDYSSNLGDYYTGPFSGKPLTVTSIFYNEITKNDTFSITVPITNEFGVIGYIDVDFNIDFYQK